MGEFSGYLLFLQCCTLFSLPHAQPVGKKLPYRIRRNHLRRSQDQPMLRMLRDQLPQLTYLVERDAAKDEDEDRLVVSEPLLSFDAQ